MKRYASILMIVIGICSVILSFVCFGKETGDTERNISYGGDAYTGIQNAAAQTANNVKYTNEILKFGFGSVLLTAGIVIVSCGIYCLSDTHEGNEQKLTPFPLTPFPESQESELQKNADSWKCYCGETVPKNQEECPACGRTRAESESIKKSSSQSTNKKVWKCSKCGRENPDYVSTCPCGQSK